MAVSGRAGAAERGQSGRQPRGVQAPVPPRRGRLGTVAAIARGAEGDFGGRGAWGCARRGQPKCRGKFLCAGEESRRASEPSPAAPAALGSEDGFCPHSPMRSRCHLQGGLITFSSPPCGKDDPSLI